MDDVAGGNRGAVARSGVRRNLIDVVRTEALRDKRGEIVGDFVEVCIVKPLKQDMSLGS